MRPISLKNCPYCGCSKIFVSRSAIWWRKVCAVVFLLRLVRCHTCMRRHFRPIFVRTAEPPAGNKAPAKGAEVFPFKKKAKRPA